MILLMSLLSLWPSEGFETVGLDELDIGKMGFTGSHQGRTIFSYSKGVSRVFPLMLFDFEAERLREIKDGRMPVIFPFVIPLEDGFALINGINVYRSKIFYVDRDGTFRRTSYTTDLPGWDENLEITHIAQEKPGRAYLTLKHRQDPMLFLALVDVDRNTLDFLTQLDLSQETYSQKIWTTDIERLFLVTRPSGRIDWISKHDFQVRQTLRSAQEPVVKDKRLRAFSGRFVNILSSPIFNGQYLGFKYLRYHDRFGNNLEEPQVKSLSLTSKGLRERDYSVLAIHDGKQLVYHWSDKELHLFPHKKEK